MIKKTAISSALVAGTVATVLLVNQITAPQPALKTMTIRAVYRPEQMWEIAEYNFEWIYTTNLLNPIWKVYTNVVGTNTLTVPTTEYNRCFITCGRIMNRYATNVFIVLDIYTNQYYKGLK